MGWATGNGLIADAIDFNDLGKNLIQYIFYDILVSVVQRVAAAGSLHSARRQHVVRV